MMNRNCKPILCKETEKSRIRVEKGLKTLERGKKKQFLETIVSHWYSCDNANRTCP